MTAKAEEASERYIERISLSAHHQLFTGGHMFAFDSLAYTRHLEGSGIPRQQAEAHAEAVQKYVVGELVTKEDLRLALETQTLRLTVRLGTIVAAATGAIIATLRFL